jgi:uncharacterized membrane-anchored protein
MVVMECLSDPWVLLCDLPAERQPEAQEAAMAALKVCHAIQVYSQAQGGTPHLETAQQATLPVVESLVAAQAPAAASSTTAMGLAEQFMGMLGSTTSRSTGMS